jgi:hypothetical protein
MSTSHVRFRRMFRSSSAEENQISWVGILFGLLVGVGTGIALRNVAVGIALAVVFAIAFGWLQGGGTPGDPEGHN